VWDRCASLGDEADLKALLAWVNNVGMDELVDRLIEDHVRGSDRGVTRVESRGFVMEASPRRSYGYLYIGAWFKADEGHCEDGWDGPPDERCAYCGRFPHPDVARSREAGTGLVRIKVDLNRELDEWQVRYYLNGVLDECKTYYASDLEDATGTAEAMREEARAQGKVVKS